MKTYRILQSTQFRLLDKARLWSILTPHGLSWRWTLWTSPEHLAWRAARLYQIGERWVPADEESKREILEFLVLSLTHFVEKAKQRRIESSCQLGYEVGSEWRKRLAVIRWGLGLSSQLVRWHCREPAWLWLFRASNQGETGEEERGGDEEVTPATS